MHKKFIATLLAISMIATTGVAYGNVEDTKVEDSDSVVEVKEDIGEVNPGVPDGPGEDLGAMEVSQGSEGLEGIPEGPQQAPEDSKNLENDEEIQTFQTITKQIAITTGSGDIDGSTFEVDSYNSIDFPGSFEVDTKNGVLLGAPVKLVNTGKTELVVYAEKCKSMDSTSPRIVEPGTFTDWTSIDEAATLSNMALGFIVDEGSTFWFSNEDSQQAEEVYRLQPGEAITLEVTGKCGTQWPSSCTINYDCTLGFEVIPLEKEITVEVPVIPEVPEQPVVPEIPEQPVVPEVPEQTEEVKENVEETEEVKENTEQPEQEGTEETKEETKDEIEQTEQQLEESTEQPGETTESDNTEDQLEQETSNTTENQDNQNQQNQQQEVYEEQSDGLDQNQDPEQVEQEQDNQNQPEIVDEPEAQEPEQQAQQAQQE